MSAKILDGRAVAAEIKDEIAKKIAARKAANQSIPGLDVILVGDDPASKVYVQHKQKACEAVGIRSQLHQLPADATQADLEAIIDRCNADPETHGILLQLPLPEQIDSAKLLERIDPKKDVDGFHPYNMGRLAQRKPMLRPCTPYGIIKLLKKTGEDLIGKHCVIVSASNIVGRPMALELLMAKSTVTVCHRYTKDLASHIQNADILISGIGKPGIIQSEWISPGTIVIDVGISRQEDGTLRGDIDFDTASQRASWITPVPGGVGPMTVATLLSNTLLAAEQQAP